MTPSMVNMLPAPFNRFFASFAEANNGFELLKTVLLTLGVDSVEYAKDRRICMSLAGAKKIWRPAPAKLWQLGKLLHFKT